MSFNVLGYQSHLLQRCHPPCGRVAKYLPISPRFARTVHHRVLLRITGAQRKRLDHRMTSHNRALEITGCESIETTLRTRRLFGGAGTLLRMSGGRLPKRIVFENLEGAVRRGRGGKEKEWTDCVQSDIRAFGIAGG